MKTAKVVDRCVICPHCDEVFEVQKSPRGSGATYVQKWKKIPAQLATVIEAWHNNIRTKPQTKVQARQRLAEYGIPLTENAASARFSELLGLGLLRVAKPEERIVKDFTTSAPQYVLNTEKAFHVINNGGYL